MNNSEKTPDAQLGKVVREFRQKRGLSQEDLAKEVGVDRKTINRIEQGHHSTSVSTFASIAHALGQKPSNLISPLDSIEP